eukprot:7076741-Pyramimonas_sp.AAC.1
MERLYGERHIRRCLGSRQRWPICQMHATVRFMWDRSSGQRPGPPMIHLPFPSFLSYISSCLPSRDE